MTAEAKTTAVGGTGYALIEGVAQLQMEHTVTFLLQTSIALLTIVYLVLRIISHLKNRKQT